MEYDRSAPSRTSASSEQLATLGRLRRQLTGLMRVQAHRILRQPDQIIAFRGELMDDSEEAYERLRANFASVGYTAGLRKVRDGGYQIIATKGVAEAGPTRPWLSLALLVATTVSVLYVGAGYAAADLESARALSLLDLMILGIPFAATVMGILLAHELSHYFVGRLYGAPHSLPYFIPLPFGLLGTMGALIYQRSPMRSRKATFDIGVAGPIGGLLVAIPLLLYGLSLSTVEGAPVGATYLQEGNSLLYLALKYLVFGRVLPSNGMDVWLHPIAFAAWAGLLITMANLLPVGQLDGGHLSYALLGRRASTVGRIVSLGVIAWGGVLALQGNLEGGGFWLLWGTLNLVLNRRHPPALNDATPVGSARLALGLAMAVVFVLLFVPAPLRSIVPTTGATL
jgi:membrane-associated protease RseP (regulator of RpoE activity)